MKITQKIVDDSLAEISGEKLSADTLAKSQWALIKDLNSQYKGKTVRGTKCKFEEDTWLSKASLSTSSRNGINWQLLETGELALQILTRSFLFEAISDRRVEIGTAVQKLRALRMSIIPVIESKELLKGDDTSVLLGLAHLTDDDLLLMLDSVLVSQTSSVKTGAICSEIVAFQTFANRIAKRVPVYVIRARLPWQKSGDSIQSWVKKRAIDLGVAFSPTAGYEPLSAETMQPVVEKSLTLIDLYFDHFATIAPIVARHEHNSKYTIGFAEDLLKKYAPIFGPIATAPNMSERFGTHEKARGVLGWLRELLYLARGACVNIILLTTGLRNGDVRGLLVDACRPSERVDMLFYLRASIQKTKNVLIIPVPGQTDKAIRLLSKLKFTESPYLLDALMFATTGKEAGGGEDAAADTDEDAEHWVKTGDMLNIMVRDFAAHFKIPFVSPTTGKSYSAHCYRTTVAGWLGAASNLSLLLVRRLFGHSNSVMPTVYLNNNPAIVAEREAQKARAHAETARQMGLAASHGLLAGVKGEQLVRGYQAHKSRMEAEKQKSHSVTDSEILVTFNEILEQRISSGAVCAFLTPFGVRCMRNPSDTSQSPCAKRAHRDKTEDIDAELLKHVSDINPEQCIGISCTEAMLGPWSTSLLETLKWYRALLNHQLGDAFSDEHFVESAKQFIQQYQAPLRKVFGLASVSNDSESAPSDEKWTRFNA